MSRAGGRNQSYYIRDLAQMRAVISPARDEILDAVAANGPCTVMALGEFLGRKPDSLYHHVRVLRRVGLLLETLSPNSQGRATAVYDVPGRPMFLRYELGDPRKVRAVTAYAGSALRIAHRRFAQGFKSDHAVVRGPARNLWAARWRGWLTQTELKKANVLLTRLAALARGGSSQRSGEAHLYDITWVLSPATTPTVTKPDQRKKRMRHN
jgi:DNA-binding transcriptional ArsR family regulator